MVINEVIKKTGVIDHPKYTYNWITKKADFVCMEPFYYKRIYIIDGERFFLGSVKEGKMDSLIEEVTGAVAIKKEELSSFTDSNILSTLLEKLNRCVFSTLHDVIVNFQNNQSAYRIELWQINLLIS